MEPTQPSTINLRALRNTLISGAILALITAQRYCGFFLIFAVPVFIAWLLYNLYVVIWVPERWRLQAAKLILWLCVFTGIACVHTYYAYSARHHADEIVAIVEKYMSERAHCPETLEPFGIDRAELKRQLGPASFYVCEAGAQPHLAYGVTYIAFDMYFYDFTKKAWVYMAD